MAYVTVDVEVDIDQFDTDDLVDELERRGKRGDTEFEPEITVPQIVEAFYVGNDQRAMELTRQFVQNATGRVLP
jgi:hypothetical protein